MIDSLSHVAFTKLAVTLWAIWWAQRKAIHEEVFQSPWETYGFITRFIADLEVVPVSSNRTTAVPIIVSTKPKAPLAGFAKLHVDAAVSKSHARGAAATVCRDISGKYMRSSALV